MLFLCSGFVAVYGARFLVVWGKIDLPAAFLSLRNEFFLSNRRLVHH